MCSYCSRVTDPDIFYVATILNQREIVYRVTTVRIFDHAPNSAVVAFGNEYGGIKRFLSLS